MAKEKPHDAPPELAEFVAQLLHTTGSLMLIVDHLSRFQASAAAPDAAPIPDLLARLLASVLVPLVEWHGSVALGEAAALISDAGELACREVFGADGVQAGRGAASDGRRARRTR